MALTSASARGAIAAAQRQCLMNAAYHLPSTAPSCAVLSSAAPGARRCLHSSSQLQAASAPGQAAKQLSDEEARKAIMAAQSKVFGTVFGDNERSGRKRLRSLLRGPRKRNYYGYSFDDIMPTFITTMKEDYFRDEEQLNRLGKTRIKGKMKEPLKDMVEAMKFEDIIEDLTNEHTEPGRPEEYLFEEEIALRAKQIAAATSPAEAIAINERYNRLVAYRERNFPAISKEVDAALGTEGGDKGKDGKREREPVQHRRGLDDKRLQGDDYGDESPVRTDKTAGSPALDTAAPGPLGAAPAGGASGPAPSTSSDGEEHIDLSRLDEDPDPLVRALATTRTWRVDPVLLDDPSPLAKQQLDASYADWVSARASATWSALESLKSDPLYAGVWAEWEQLVTGAGEAMSKEGLTKWMEATEDRKAAEAQAKAVARSPAVRARPAPAPAAAPPAAAPVEPAAPAPAAPETKA